MSKKMPQKHPAGEVKIIAGKLRSRKISFPSNLGIRPTPNRTRETLFNWLQNDIPSSNCLDMFAGSGALAIEALSRGAQSALAIDSNLEAIKCLQEHKALFDLPELDIVQGAIPHLQIDNHKKYNLIFMDPPFKQGLIKTSIQWLMQGQILQESALIFLEQENHAQEITLPLNWQIIKTSRTKETVYNLVKVFGK